MISESEWNLTTSRPGTGCGATSRIGGVECADCGTGYCANCRSSLNRSCVAQIRTLVCGE